MRVGTSGPTRIRHLPPRAKGFTRDGKAHLGPRAAGPRNICTGHRRDRHVGAGGRSRRLGPPRDRGHLGSKSLNLSASALEVSAGTLYVGGKFTDAGGIPNADRIAKWNGSSWSAVSSSTEQITNGEVFAIAIAGGKVYAGGTFANAGTAGADNLAVWDGTSWKPFCTPPAATIGNVKALQVVGPTLYVGGDFQDGAGIATADYLLACDLATGTPSATTVDPAHPFSGSVKALTATSDGTLYAGGRFGNLENIDGRRQRRLPAARRDVARHGLQRRRPACGCALDAFVRGLATDGTDVFVGTEGSDVAGIAQADHVAKWNGSAGAPWARTPPARTGGSRRRPTSTASPASARTCSPPGRSRTPTATRAPTTSRGSTAPPGTRSGPTAPATARGSARAQPSRSSTGSSMRRGTSRAPAVTPRRSPPPRSRSRR